MCCINEARCAAATDYEAPPHRGAKVRIEDQEAMAMLAFHGGYRATRLAEQLGISPRHLRRLFADHVGCSPQTWLREQRMQFARRMLAAGSSVKEVAYALEFSHQSQFSRDFKRRFGLSPSVERKSTTGERPCGTSSAARDGAHAGPMRPVLEAPTLHKRSVEICRSSFTVEHQSPRSPNLPINLPI